MPDGDTASTAPSAPSRPAAGLLAVLRPELARHPPFAQMGSEQVDDFLAHAEQRYYAPGEVLVDPTSGVVREIFFVRQGSVAGSRGIAEVSGGAIRYEPGELFPLSAAVARRAVTATYRAQGDVFALALPVAAMDRLAAASPVFADFLSRRIARFMDLSRQALQASYAAQALAEQSLESPLAALRLRPPVRCAPGTPLAEALAEMQRLRVGSIVVTGSGGEVQGIFTRQDVLGRVTLPAVPLSTPIAEVMVHPVHTLPLESTAEDAALLMSRHGIRHVPVTRDGVLAGVVSERDLFALQRLSLKQVSSALRAAPDVPALALLAHDIRRFARNLVGQGVQARQLTVLVSHLNDVLTQRLLELQAQHSGFELHRACWLALGSEGRGEQTIATDQDNALVLPDDWSEAQRRAALAFGRAVNETLAECGYPLCRGGIMAGEPGCCLPLAGWRERFRHWVDHGAPQDLLDASIFFDLRPLAGHAQLAAQLQAEVLEAAPRTPRFLKQLALNALARGTPLAWHGGLATDEAGTLDLKLQGTALFVDAARVYGLAQGVAATGTRERLAAAGERMGLAAGEYEAWVAAFEFLQMLRLRVQLAEGGGGAHPNRLRVADLNDIDQRILRESLRMARRLQQRMQLDYER